MKNGAGISLVLAGAAGEGVQTIGAVLAQTLALTGYPVFTWQDFESRIRGGNSSYSLRISPTCQNAPAGEADLLLALNPTALDHYRPGLKKGGIAVRQGSGGSENDLAADFSDIAKKEHGSGLYANSIAVGFLCSLLGLPFENLESALRSNFGHKGEEIVHANAKAARTGFDLAPADRCALDASLKTGPAGKPRYFLSGHEALALAACAAGMRFIASYPMSPSTSIIAHLAQRQEELGLFLVQAEDEIAAINMVLGASYAGARAMTTTSGGGFALMVEAISLAGMTETPAVVVLAMRPGPATGLPTRTAQGDLHFAVRAGHGEFPKAVLAPADAAGVFPAVQKAFHLADRYQIPVVLLTDQHLADSKYLIEEPRLDTQLQRTQLADPESVRAPYRRYDLASGPLSPRLYPGQSAHLVCADSDEHDEEGHITEDLASTVPLMVAKRRQKTELLRTAISMPTFEGPEDAQLILVSWGSSYHAVREARLMLSDRGISVAHQHFTELWPLPPLSPPKSGKLISVEGNGTGQLAYLLKAEAGYNFHRHIGRTDGLPLDAAHILRELGENP